MFRFCRLASTKNIHTRFPKRFLRVPLNIIVLLFLPAIVCAEPVRGEFWLRNELIEVSEFDQDIREVKTKSDRGKEAVNQLLDDTRWAFSGIIYGFDVLWSPAAKIRGIEEILEIHPVAMIPRDDPRMKNLVVHQGDGILYIMLEYHPDAIQQRRISAWQSQIYPFAAGVGLAPLHVNQSRRRAMESAIKESLRNYFRAREYNRPKEIRMRVGLLAFPSTGLVGFRVKATVTLAIDIQSSIPYRVD